MRLTFLTIFLGFGIGLQAQNKPVKKITRAEADSIRSVVMNKELLLNPNEASRFWPLYEKELREIQKLNREYFIWFSQHKNLIDQMANSEVQDFLEKQDDYLQKKLELRRRYDFQFRRILSLKQLAHLYLSEDKFARELVQYRIRKGLND